LNRAVKNILFSHPPIDPGTSFPFGGINKDSTRKWGLLRLVKGWRFLLWKSSNSTSQLAKYPAVARCRQSGVGQPTYICTPRVNFMLDASLHMVNEEYWISALYQV
jgi:hypothetical protein